MINFPITLVRDTIDESDIDSLVSWLKTNPRLTKGQKTLEFENMWSNWLGCKYSLFVNSGSSANLAMIYALLLSGRLKNKKIVFPCLSWVTTVSPAIQLGMEPILCDVDENLSLNIDDLREIFEKENPSVLMLVHALGFPNDMKSIMSLCEEFGVVLLEDSCETVGSLYEGRKTGTFGLASSFSSYYGHHFSTIEGGFVCTDDYELYNILKSIRSHGWSRDLDEISRKKLQYEHGIDEFKNLYTFYYPGFNLRSTDLQAFLGISQIKKLNGFCEKRYKNFLLYDNLINNSYWKIDASKFDFVSNFAYPIIHPNSRKIVSELMSNKIECRPLIAGNIAKQPFFYKLYGNKEYKFSDIIHEHGFYVPNNHNLSEVEIGFISSIINKYTT